MGNDTLSIDSGTDADGGSEDDTLLVEEDLALAATLNGGPGTDTLVPLGTRTLAPAVTLLGIERLALDAATLTLTAAQLNAFDTIVADGPATAGSIALRLGGSAIVEVTELASVEIAGSDGADLLFLSSPGTTAVDFEGGLGDDLANLTGAAGGHSLAGGEGDDTLDGDDGAGDTLDGGAEADLIFVGAGDGGLGGTGDDRLRLAAGVTLFASGALFGGEGEDTLEAPDADATIGGGATLDGLEVLALGAGRLALRAAALDGFDAITGQEGTAAGRVRLLSAGAVEADVAGLEALTVTGTNEADELVLLSGAAGTEADITVVAGGGDDAASTETGDDLLDGGAGADTLFGSVGIDTLIGGIGADSLVAMDGDSLLGGRGDDTLLAFGDLGPGTVLDGGADTDSLDPFGSFEFSAGLSVLGVERLIIGGTAAPVVSAEVLAAIPTIVARAGATEGTLVLGDAAAAAAVEVTELASLRVLGAAEADALTFTSAATAITVEAGEGEDTIDTGTAATGWRGRAARTTSTAAAAPTRWRAARGRTRCAAPAAPTPSARPRRTRAPTTSAASTRARTESRCRRPASAAACSPACRSSRSSSWCTPPAQRRRPRASASSSSRPRGRCCSGTRTAPARQRRRWRWPSCET